MLPTGRRVEPHCVVARCGFAANTNGAEPSFLFGFCPGQGRRRKPIVCPTLAKNRRSAQTNKDLVAQAFVPVWLGRPTRCGLHLEQLRLRVAAAQAETSVSEVSQGNVDGTLSADDFSAKALQKFGKDELRRSFCGEEDLVRINDQTCAISNQWDLSNITALQKITEAYPHLKAHFEKAEA